MMSALFQLLLVPSCTAYYAHPARLPMRSASVLKRCLPSMALGEGTLVEFARSGTVALGAITEPDGKKNWKVVTANGNTVSIAPRAITVNFGQLTEPASADVVARHEQAAEQHGTHRGADALEELWDIASEEDSAFALEELADLLIGDSSSESRFAAHRLLSSGFGRALFRTNKAGDAFTARPAAEAAVLRVQTEAEAAAKAEEEALRERVHLAVSSRGLRRFDLADESDRVREEFEALERLACRAHAEAAQPQANQLEEEPTDGLARALLQRLGRKATAESGRQLMVQLGLWSAHENLELRRLRIPVSFGSELVASASALEAQPPADQDASRRLDLSHLPAFAIDDASTVEVDDAMSVEVLDEGGAEAGDGRSSGGRAVRLWVHIADPTRFIAQGSDLDVEARRRGSSIYLPTGTIPMFPLPLAAGPLSLREDAASCALSFGVRLDASGAIDPDHPPLITPSLVRVKRLTYEDVDAALGDPFAQAAPTAGLGEVSSDEMESLRRLEWLSSLRLSWRIAGGSMEGIAPEGLPDMRIKAVQRPPPSSSGPAREEGEGVQEGVGEGVGEGMQEGVQEGLAEVQAPRAGDGEAHDSWDVSVGVGGSRPDGPARRVVTESMLLAGDVAARRASKHA